MNILRQFKAKVTCNDPSSCDQCNYDDCDQVYYYLEAVDPREHHDETICASCYDRDIQYYE